MANTNFLRQLYKHTSNFKPKNRINNNGRFSHGLFLMEKWKNGQKKSRWYAKCLGRKRNETLAEILTQEMMRLILPQQPKTRRMIDVTKEGRIEYWVLSKEIPNFDHKFFLKEENNQAILTQNVKGLAATQVLALWLNEVDFKAGNVGVDRCKNEVIKIDGGLSFITLNDNFHYLHSRNFNITSADLEALPNLVHYEACNWLHHIQWGKKEGISKKAPTALDKRINQSLEFKNELYCTILRIISLPDPFIQFFTRNYISNSDDVTRFSEFLIERKAQLASAAEEIPAFEKYCQSQQAQKEILDFLKYLSAFKTMEKYAFCRAFKKMYKIDIVATVKEYIPLKKFVSELDSFMPRLDSIDLEMKFNFSIDHKKIITYIKSLKENVTLLLSQPTNLEKNKLNSTLANVVKNIKNEFVIQNSIISSLIESINNLLCLIDRPKKIKKLIPTTEEKFKRLPTIEFFNKNPPQVSQVYQKYDLQSHEFIY